MRRQRDRESEDWAVLANLSGPGRAFSQAEAARARGRGAASPYCHGEFAPTGVSLESAPSPPWTRPPFSR